MLLRGLRPQKQRCADRQQENLLESWLKTRWVGATWKPEKEVGLHTRKKNAIQPHLQVCHPNALVPDRKKEQKERNQVHIKEA